MKTKNKINESTAQTHSRNNGTHRTHYTHLVTFPKAAFTLAEVLITLAIIGVVAAMTLPSLINNYQDKALETAHKKSMSVLSNALLQSIANSETFSDLRTTQLISQGCTRYDSGSVSVNAEELNKHSRAMLNIGASSLDSNFKKQMESITYDLSAPPGMGGSGLELLGLLIPPANAKLELAFVFKEQIWKDSEYYFVTNDGIVYGYSFKSVPDRIKNVGFFVITDVNGAKRPNKLGKDLYLLGVNFNGKVGDFTCQIAETRGVSFACREEDYQNVFGISRYVLTVDDGLGQAGQEIIQ